MADQHKSDDHPEAPGLSSMAWFALFLFILLMTIVLTLQTKFGTPTAG